jgi:hypothetical protein
MPFKVSFMPGRPSAMRSLATSTFTMIDQLERLGEAGRRRSGGIGVRLGEMPGIELEQRLDGDVEGAVAVARQGCGEGQDLDEFQRRMVENALGVEAHQGGVGPVEAEDGLEPADLGQAALDEPPGRVAVGMHQRHRCHGAHGHAPPHDRRGGAMACGETIGRAAALPRWRRSVGVTAWSRPQ